MGQGGSNVSHSKHWVILKQPFSVVTYLEKESKFLGEFSGMGITCIHYIPSSLSLYGFDNIPFVGFNFWADACAVGTAHGEGAKHTVPGTT